MKPLLIQFTGAQSTGKTTFAKELVRFLECSGVQVHWISEISRNFKKQGVIENIDIEADSLTQFILNDELLLQYFKYYTESNDREIIITERSPICCLAYGTLLKNQTSLHSFVLEQNRRLLHILRKLENIKTIYFPLAIPFEDDGIRIEESRTNIDLEIQYILNSFGIKHFVLHLGDLRMQLVSVLDYIGYKYDLNTLNNYLKNIPENVISIYRYERKH
jgi:thymidylate kinase